MSPIHAAEVEAFIVETFSGVETAEAFGFTFFSYKTDNKMPFATLASSDNEYDSVSDLDRPGVFRLNIGISKESFQSLFGYAELDMDNYDFTALDVIMPHPEYAKQHFICVLSPGETTFEMVRALLAEAYAIAVQRYTRQNKNP
jgi:hypothetical protein